MRYAQKVSRAILKICFSILLYPYRCKIQSMFLIMIITVQDSMSQRIYMSSPKHLPHCISSSPPGHPTSPSQTSSKVTHLEMFTSGTLSQRYDPGQWMYAKEKTKCVNALILGYIICICMHLIKHKTTFVPVTDL